MRRLIIKQIMYQVDNVHRYRRRGVSMKKRWEPMMLTRVGHISKVVQGGAAKLSGVGDPGEPQKQIGTG